MNGEVVHQPDIYLFAAYLARRFSCTSILDIGCGRALKLVALHPEFQIIGVDCGLNLQYCRQSYRFGTWLECDLETVHPPFLPEPVLRKTLIICSDVIEHLVHPEHLMQTLSSHLRFVPAMVLSTPERDLVRGILDTGPPANPSHVREWNRAELGRLLRKSGMPGSFLGLTVNNDKDLQKKTTVAVVHNSNFPEFTNTPKTFHVTAIMTAYNEADIILPSILRLLSQDIAVHLIDNWSDDASEQIIQPLVEKGFITYERFPTTGATTHYEWRRLLARIEELSSTLESDWFVHHDVDEIRNSPWPDLSLRDGIYLADIAGYNAIDHSVIEFRPTDNGYIAGTDFGDYFHHWDFGCRPGHFQQIKAWKNLGQRVDLRSTGGHEAAFFGRRVFPYKFLLRHYPIRTVQQGTRKVFKERLNRFSPAERADGWHSQYDGFEQTHQFLHHPSTLNRFVPSEMYVTYLIELLSGIGIVRPRRNFDDDADAGTGSRNPRKKWPWTLLSWLIRQ